MSERAPRNLAMAFVLAAAVVSFIAFIVLMVFGDDMVAPPSHGADGYSVSALGHRAFRRLLEESGTVVSSSRFDSAKRAAESSSVCCTSSGWTNSITGRPTTMSI